MDMLVGMGWTGEGVGLFFSFWIIHYIGLICLCNKIKYGIVYVGKCIVHLQRLHV
jgi:hypothetical protein